MMDSNMLSKEQTGANAKVDTKAKEVCIEPLRGAQKRKRRSIYSRQVVLNSQEENTAADTNDANHNGNSVKEAENDFRTRKSKRAKTMANVSQKDQTPKTRGQRRAKLQIVFKNVPKSVRQNKKRSLTVKHNNDTSKENKANTQSKNTQTDSKQKANKNGPKPVFKENESDENEKFQIARKAFIEKNVDDLRCKICNKEFTKRGTVYRHVICSHFSDGKEHPCDGCSLKFKNKFKLHFHKRRIHSDETILCEKCGKKFNQKSRLQYHNITNHGVKVPLLKCEWEGCEKVFRFQNNKNRHMKAVHIGERNYPCKECPLKFKTSGALTTHVYSIHTAEELKKKFPCLQCKKVFHSHSKLKYHRTIHLDEVEAKKFFCTYEGCDKRFRLSNSLKKHEKVHANIRPFSCTVCDQSFTRIQYLESHQYKHTGVKKYQCEICNKSFTQNGNLTVHMKIHSGKRDVFTCDVCGRKFNFKSNFTKHVKSHEDGSISSSSSTSTRRGRRVMVKDESTDMNEDPQDVHTNKGKDETEVEAIPTEQLVLVSEKGEIFLRGRSPRKRIFKACVSPKRQPDIVYIINHKQDDKVQADIESQEGVLANDKDNAEEKKVVYQDEADEVVESTAAVFEKSHIPAEVLEAISREGYKFTDPVTVTYVNADGESNIVTINPDMIRDTLEKVADIESDSSPAEKDGHVVKLITENADGEPISSIASIQNFQSESPELVSNLIPNQTSTTISEVIVSDYTDIPADNPLSAIEDVSETTVVMGSDVQSIFVNPAVLKTGDHVESVNEICTTISIRHQQSSEAENQVEKEAEQYEIPEAESGIEVVIEQSDEIA